MTAKTLSCITILLLSCRLWGQVSLDHPPSNSELADVTARGRALAEYDAAAWHSSDAVLALKPTAESVQLYVARKTENGWAVDYGRFDDARTKFLIAYEAQQSGTSDDYTVTKHDPAVEDTDYYFRAARALELAKADFLSDVKPQRPYNFSILPTPSATWYCYAIPAQTDASILPYGGDVRYRVSPDGTQILEKRQMHKTVLEEQVGERGPFLGFHTHVLSDVPEDSDVFYALTRKAAQGDLIATKKYFFQVQPGGDLVCLGKTAAIVKLIEEDRFETIPELGKSTVVKSMLLSSAHDLLKGALSGNPLEVFSELTGQRCVDHAVWLKFSHTLHNVGETKIILYRQPLQNSQARFAATEADIQNGKYEKLAFFSIVKPDYSDKDAFFVLSPGMSYGQDREYPIFDLDLRGKGAVQFLFFTWPLGEEKQIEAQSARWREAGSLYSDTLVAAPMPLKVDAKFVQDCTTK